MVEAEMETAWESIGGILMRLKASSRVPDGARALPFEHSDKGQVAALHAQYVAENAHSPNVTAPGLIETLERSTLGRSAVLELDGQVLGFMLVSATGPTITVTSHVMRPEYRGTWADLMLVASAIERGCRAGKQRFRFEIPEGNRQTHRMAERCQARTVAIRERFVRSL